MVASCWFGDWFCYFNSVGTFYSRLCLVSWLVCLFSLFVLCFAVLKFVAFVFCLLVYLVLLFACCGFCLCDYVVL